MVLEGDVTIAIIEADIFKENVSTTKFLLVMGLASNVSFGNVNKKFCFCRGDILSVTFPNTVKG